MAQIDFFDPKHPSGIRVRGGPINGVHGHAQRVPGVSASIPLM